MLVAGYYVPIYFKQFISTMRGNKSFSVLRVKHLLVFSAAIATQLVGAATISFPRTNPVDPIGTPITWTVPAGVTSLNVIATGAGGGGGGAGMGGSAGGSGAVVTSTLSVNPGEIITVVVGGGGGGGGDQIETRGGGGGGGSSSVNAGTPNQMIAGGGGGGANSSQTKGGDAGGVSGIGGNGQGNGGTGGSNGIGGAAYTEPGVPNGNGGNGDGGAGGRGGGFTPGAAGVGLGSGQGGDGNATTGGGGGGGYGGGGAGLGFGGGGAGGSTGPAGSTYTTASNGGASGVAGQNGLVVITYSDPSVVPPNVSLVCVPTQLTDSPNQVSTCTVTSDAAAGSTGLSVNLTLPAPNPRYSTTCATPIVIAAGTTSAICTVTATENTVVGDGDVRVDLSIATPVDPKDYVISGSAAQILVKDDDDVTPRSPTPVPTLAQWALIGLTTLISMVGIGRLRRRPD